MAPAFGRFRPRGFPTLVRIPTSIKAARSNRSISVVSPTPQYRPLEIIALLTDLPGDRRHRYRICSVGVRIAMRIAVVPSPGSRLALAQEEPPNEPTTPITTRRYRERKTPPIHCARIAAGGAHGVVIDMSIASRTRTRALRRAAHRSDTRPVSTHYLVPDAADEGKRFRVYARAPESTRAWYAGISYWQVERLLSDLDRHRDRRRRQARLQASVRHVR